MEKKIEIKYLSHYNTLMNKQKRCATPSACSKIEYIANSISSKKDVKIISASNSLRWPCLGKLIKTNERISVKFLFGFLNGPSLIGKISDTLFYLNLYFYLLFTLKKDDVLIVYHALPLMGIITQLKSKLHFKLILEIEEIYGDVVHNKTIINKEMEFFSKADAYIFPTKLLNDLVNIDNKPYSIIHGTYSSNQNNKILKKFSEDDGKVHCVYAGTFDARKGGVNFAIESSKYLDENYHIHIMGFGSKNEIENVVSEISNISKKIKCKLTYEGCLTGKEYEEFLQKCDIGLSTQNPEDDFNDTSFPSKILSYMANGLRVISVNIPAVYTSEIKEYVYYYDKYIPEEMAKIINETSINDSYDGKKIVESLDMKFKNDIYEMIQRIIYE